MTQAPTMLSDTAARLEVELSIRAPRERVWQLLCTRADDWWIPDFRCVGPDSEIRLEARAGGCLAEFGKGGDSLLWFQVIAVQAPQSLNLAGDLAPPYGGPCRTLLLIELEEQGKDTTLRITNTLHGHISESSLPQIRDGWEMIFSQGLKALAEAGD